MNVFFFETNNASPHLETSLELAKKHLDVGDTVYYYFLGHSVTHSEFVRAKRIINLFMPERRAISLMGENFNFIEPDRNSVMRHFSIKFDSFEELRKFKYKEYNAGLSTCSSLISKLRQSKPAIDKHADVINDILASGISIYEFVMQAIENNSVDLIYLFNGRFANNRAVLDAAIHTGTPFLIHERGANKYRYSVNPFMPHDFAKVRSLMLDSWTSSIESRKVQVAKRFFEERREGKEQGWKSFVTDQRKGWLPNYSLPSKRLVTYFTSSDDEYADVGDIVKWERWPNQFAAVQDLVQIVSEHPELYLIIRVHPHMAEKSQEDLDEWLHLPLPENASLIMPTDPTDTYTLIEQSDVVVTCGSTVGIESVFWGTPSLCLGPSLYDHLDAVHLPNDKDKLKQMLLDDSLSANLEKTLPYGYYMATFGTKFMYYKPIALFSGEFLGVNLQAYPMQKYLHLVKSLVAKVIKR